ncbi:MAG TPA: hypothetical protein VI874_03310 [Candidatus Norongarragalinales archaeon]|nr:hypothetical protein [Candidatus Norongarragalinales archaeon]
MNVSKKTGRSLHGQAAIFDGITLMLLASLSAAMIFSFLGSYGVQEERVIRSAYVINYMQSVMKTFYYLDASTLSKVSNMETDSSDYRYPISLYDDLSQPGGCRDLESYRGTISVSDLLKRDLAEKDEILDDRFESASIIGITAVRCAFKELVKPFAFSGYFYGFDVLRENQQSVLLENFKKTVTNFEPFTHGPHTGGVCVKANSVASEVLTVSVPSRVVYIDKKAPPGEQRKIRRYEVRLCIWRPLAGTV